MILCYDALGKKENENIVSGDALSELYGEGWDSDERFYAGIRSVTREDVIAVAKKIFDSPALRIFVRPEPPAAQ
jgi:predicted Zn-dependent peptidase